MVRISGRRKSLPEIIESGEKDHAGEHRRVFLHRDRLGGKQHPHRRFGQPIGEQIADGYVDNEAKHLSPGAFPVAEGEVLVEKKAQHTAHQVVGG